MGGYPALVDPRSGLQPIRREAGLFDIWLLDLETAAPDVTVLSEEECGRADRFVKARDRNRFALTRAALRAVLGAATGVGANEIRFEMGPFGKPSLAGRKGPDFNVSHAGSLALIGLAYGCAIGVDIEIIREAVDELALARAFFCAAEHRQLLALDKEEQARAFYRIWTCKEAALKALGVGIADHLQDFAVELTLDGLVIHPEPACGALDFGRVRAAPLKVRENYAAAMALVLD